MSRISLTLSIYIMKQFLLSLAIVNAVLLSVVMLFDAVEVIRRLPSDLFSFGYVIEFVLLKLPYMAQMLMPFMILLASLLTYVRMTRSSELIVMRSVGISAWQFLLPSVATSCVWGILFMVLLNPLAASMLARLEKLEAKILEGQSSSFAVSASGLWLRQGNPENGGSTVIHAQRVGQEDMTLFNVIFFILDKNNRFIERVDATQAALLPHQWNIKDAYVTAAGKASIFHKEVNVPTTLSLHYLQDSFSAPQTLGFWELPGFISMLQKAGFSALRHVLYWNQLLSMPFLFGAMVYIGAAFSLQLPRQGRTGMLMMAGIAIGLGFKFLSDIVSALGLAGSIPLIFAAWAPVAIALFLGAALMLHWEDG